MNCSYCLQHVLERGKSNERSQIISKLAGKIVQLSQHKYASNVVEKCLEYGDAAERELLIEEIIGQSEENDNLLVRQIKILIYITYYYYFSFMSFVEVISFFSWLTLGGLEFPCVR